MKRFLSENGIVYALATGVLFGTSYPPFPAWALWGSLAPLWIFWFRAKTLRQVLISGFVAQFVYQMIGFNWIAHVAQEFGHLPYPIALLTQVLFASIGNIQTLAVGFVVFSIKRRYSIGPVWFFLLAAALYSVAENFWPQIFPFNYGYPLYYSQFNAAQLAEFIGFYGISFVVLVGNSFVAFAAYQYPRRRWFVPLIILLTMIVTMEGLGLWALSRLPNEDLKTQVLIIQPNIGNFDKHYATYGPQYQGPVADKLFEITREAISKTTPPPDLVVWPETAYPQSLDKWFSNQVYYQKIVDFAKNTSLSFIVGAYSDDPPNSYRPKNYNAIFGFDRGILIENNYRKHILLAFGEYFPGGDYFPFLLSLIPEISNFGRGSGPTLLSVGGVQYSPLICYEILEPLYVAKAVSLGAQIMVNLTNDSWFGDDFEPFQHLYMGAGRSIEFRTPIIRSTNTGISTVIDARGHFLLQGPQNQEWSQAVTLPYYSRPMKTIYASIASLLPWLLLSIAILIGILAVRNSHGKKRA